MIKEETQPPSLTMTAIINNDKIGNVIDCNYDYISFLVNSIDYDCNYSKNCNRLQSIMIDDYNYPMSVPYYGSYILVPCVAFRDHVAGDLHQKYRS